MDGAEREGGGERMHICMLTVFVGGDTVETGAAVTVQSLSKGSCTARVTQLGLTEIQLVPRATRPGDEPPLLYSSVMKGCTSATFDFEY